MCGSTQSAQLATDGALARRRKWKRDESDADEYNRRQSWYTAALCREEMDVQEDRRHGPEEMESGGGGGQQGGAEGERDSMRLAGEAFDSRRGGGNVEAHTTRLGVRRMEHGVRTAERTGDRTERFR